MSYQLRLIKGGRPDPLKKGDAVIVAGKPGTVVCPAFQTHVFRDMITVDYGSGCMDLVQMADVKRPEVR